jgi:hypothetical protein
MGQSSPLSLLREAAITAFRQQTSTVVGRAVEQQPDFEGLEVLPFILPVSVTGTYDEAPPGRMRRELGASRDIFYHARLFFVAKDPTK